MKEKQITWAANKALIAMMTLIVTYFSIVSTFTNARVSQVADRTDRYAEEAAKSERNIAVILEKIKNIESMIVLMREEIRQRQERRHSLE